MSAPMASPAAYAPAVRLPDDDIPAPPVAANARNPMMAKAAPLLALLAGVRAGRARTSLPDLHGKVSAAIADFDREMRGKYSEEQVRRARLWLWLYRSGTDVVTPLVPQWEVWPADHLLRSMRAAFRHIESDADPLFASVERMWARREPMLTRVDFGPVEVRR